MSKKKRQQVSIPPQFVNSKAPDFKIVFASGVFGGLNPNHGQMIFFVDRLEPEMVKDRPGQQRLSKINREYQVEVHVSPSQFKSMSQWMARHVVQYEANFGEIPLRPQSDDEEDNPLVT